MRLCSLTFVRIYQHHSDVVLWLLSDSALIAVKQFRREPFEELLAYTIEFDAHLPVTRLVLEHIPDTRCMRYLIYILVQYTIRITRNNSTNMQITGKGCVLILFRYLQCSGHT